MSVGTARVRNLFGGADARSRAIQAARAYSGRAVPLEDVPEAERRRIGVDREFRLFGGSVRYEWALVVTGGAR